MADSQRRGGMLAYILPFAVFLGILAVRNSLPVSETVLYGGWVVVIAAVLFVFSRHVIDLGMAKPLGTVAVGVAVFVIWVAPDALFPGYRSHWLFQNGITGRLSASISEAGRTDPLLLTLRVIRAVVLVPILEELFWRGFLMRWLVKPDFESVPLGAYEHRAFWLTAILFASEHGPYWDVGLAAGAIYNWWILRTRRLGDVIWAHAITNACLCLYVIATGKWEYWM